VFSTILVDKSVSESFFFFQADYLKHSHCPVADADMLSSGTTTTTTALTFWFKSWIHFPARWNCRTNHHRRNVDFA
jgi:hypothetical protein